MKAKGCLVAVAVARGLFTIVLALTGPTLMREGARLYKPIAEMEGAQADFEAWSEEHRFSGPAEETATGTH